jgi:hypothetical protein
MKEVRRDADIAKFGAREKIEFAYFSTIHALVENRTSWGNLTSQYLGEFGFEIDAEKLFDRADEIRVTPGSSFEIEGEVVLVIRGNKHALLVRNYRDFNCEPIKHFTNLTLGALLKRREFNLNVSPILATDVFPSPIATRSVGRWDLVVGANGARGWKHRNSWLFISPSLIDLHSYVNHPHGKL